LFFDEGMGQVFTVMFDFRDDRHVASVTVCNVQLDKPVYYVRLFNPELHKIIPGGRFRYSSGDDSMPDSFQHPWAKELFLSIKEAISVYLEKGPIAESEILNKEHHDQNTDTISW
jgi:hypothetical protein